MGNKTTQVVHDDPQEPRVPVVVQLLVERARLQIQRRVEVAQQLVDHARLQVQRRREVVVVVVTVLNLTSMPQLRWLLDAPRGITS